MTVLLVAACDASREELAEALRANGLEVECADSAAECIRIVRQLTPAVIVMDRMLPDGDGWELVRVLKSLSSTQGVPVIAVTGNGSRAHEERAHIIGCDVFLVRPFQADALLAQIRRLLRPERTDSWALAEGNDDDMPR